MAVAMDSLEAITALANGEVVKDDLDAESLSLLADYGIVSKAGDLSLPNCHLLDPTEIHDALNDMSKNWVQQLEISACTSSTNTDLLKRANDTNINGHIRAAEVQLAGRGRRGRQWVSPFGQNIMVSMGAVVDQPATVIGSISLAIGVGLANAIESIGIKDVQLKWPNDVLIQGEKVAGILVEMASAKQPVSLVIGMGVNVHAAPGEEVTGEYRATMVEKHHPSVDRSELLSRVINEVVLAIKKFDQDPLSAMGDSWQKRDFLIGKLIHVSDSDSDFSGMGAGIDVDGAYQVKNKEGLHRIIGGTVRVA